MDSEFWFDLPRTPSTPEYEATMIMVPGTRYCTWWIDKEGAKSSHKILAAIVTTAEMSVCSWPSGFVRVLPCQTFFVWL
jgi:hypothetical protein